MSEGLYLSVIVPVYNEGEAVTALHAEILDVCLRLNKSFEIIFVNDGSSDNTLSVLKTLKPIKIIALRRNFGQTAAMDAGISQRSATVAAMPTCSFFRMNWSAWASCHAAGAPPTTTVQ